MIAVEVTVGVTEFKEVKDERATSVSAGIPAHLPSFHQSPSEAFGVLKK